ncbi:hypothetical protein EOA16_31825 [Mesorhizobium sp. M7A.F.Ca.US.008.03.1.1]|nr:hypothetical protein EOA16_31825 [Mesorhizobium sp. M7A.F.Ca.US.008.03.1.1]
MPAAIPGKVRSGFPSGIAPRTRDRAVLRFRETMNRSVSIPCAASPAQGAFARRQLRVANAFALVSFRAVLNHGSRHVLSETR